MVSAGGSMCSRRYSPCRCRSPRFPRPDRVSSSRRSHRTSVLGLTGARTAPPRSPSATPLAAPATAAVLAAIAPPPATRRIRGRPLPSLPPAATVDVGAGVGAVVATQALAAAPPLQLGGSPQQPLGAHPWMGYFAPYGSPFPPLHQPRAPWTAPNSAGILGPRPGQHHQVYNAGASSSSNPAPWDNYAALNNIAVQQQQHGGREWFLDTGATSHVPGPQNPAHPNDVQ
ncbi:atherin-like isoform X2 [Triticum aestivum]|uniref:atherin-like isoform X2 n=1 Tax=Triticum aestivum TaxID=4565 RepID=UPI001D03559A|nr:atherin-like isoform X2 [Triticum aestivum]